MIANGDVNVKDYGAVGDYDFATGTGTDDTAAFQAAFAEGRRVYIPAGFYYITSSLAIPTGDPNVHEFYGDGIEQTILCFDGTSGITCDASGSVFRTFGIHDVGATSGSKAIVRGSITAGTIGLRIYGNDILVEQVRVKGFDKGIQSDSKFYSNFMGCIVSYNLTGFYATSGANANQSYGGHYSANFEKNVWVDGGDHLFNGCTIEGCADYDNDQANYPNGGILVGDAAITYPINNTRGTPSATFIDCYFEDNNMFLNARCSIARMAGGANTRINAAAPPDLHNVLNEATGNILPPPYYNTWRELNSTINNDPTYVDGGFKYSRVVSASGSGTSKNITTVKVDTVDGMIPPTAAGFNFNIYVGMWINIKSSNFTGFGVSPKLVDVDGTTYSIETDSRMFPTQFDRTLVDEWQYIGFMSPVRNTFSTGKALTQIYLDFGMGAPTEDHSASNRIFWIANPEIRLLFADHGHISGRASMVHMEDLYIGDHHLGTGTPTQNRTLAVDIEGTTYYLLASTSAT